MTKIKPVEDLKKDQAMFYPSMNRMQVFPPIVAEYIKRIAKSSDHVKTETEY